MCLHRQRRIHWCTQCQTLLTGNLEEFLESMKSVTLRSDEADIRTFEHIGIGDIMTDQADMKNFFFLI